MFLLVAAYPDCPGQTAVKWLLLLFSGTGGARQRAVKRVCVYPCFVT